jgi:hypothetical protein
MDPDVPLQVWRICRMICLRPDLYEDFIRQAEASLPSKAFSLPGIPFLTFLLYSLPSPFFLSFFLSFLISLLFFASLVSFVLTSTSPSLPFSSFPLILLSLLGFTNGKLIYNMLPETARQISNGEMDGAVFSIFSFLAAFDAQKLSPSIYEHLFLLAELTAYLLFAGASSKDKVAALPSSLVRRWIEPLTDKARAALRGLQGVYSRLGKKERERERPRDREKRSRFFFSFLVFSPFPLPIFLVSSSSPFYLF